MRTRRRYLGIYLNDHLAGAVAGVRLAQRLAAHENAWADDVDRQRLADQVAEDRQALEEMITALGLPVRRHKVWTAWAAERVGRLKLNGRLFARSPLSRVFELEAMRLAVEGKAAGWRTLRTYAESDAVIDADLLDHLHGTAQEQIGQLERLRVRAVADLFGGDAPAGPRTHRP